MTLTETKANSPSQQPHHIAIVKLSSLGDIVHTLPAFQQLREHFPKSRISWFVEPLGAKLLENFPAIDEIIPVRLKAPGIFQKISEVRRILSLYRGKFDIVLDFQGLIKSAILSHLLKGKVTGFHKENCREPIARLFYHQQAEPFDENLNVIYKNLHLVKHIFNGAGAPASFREAVKQPAKALQPPLYPVRNTQAGSDDLRHFLDTYHLQPGEFIVVNVGGGWPTKLLSAEQFTAVIKGWRETSNKPLPVVILWGNEQEKKVAEEIVSAVGETDVIAVIFFGFADVLRLLEMGRLIVTGDTLALHLADLVQTPSVGIFGPTSPERNGSLMQDSIAVYKNLPCNFCYKKKCGTIECIEKISIEKIITSIEKINEKFS